MRRGGHCDMRTSLCPPVNPGPAGPRRGTDRDVASCISGHACFHVGDRTPLSEQHATR